MRLFIFMIVLLSNMFGLKANSLRADCDTLLSNSGTLLVVRIESVKQGVIEYYDCEGGGKLQRMDFSEIREIRRGRELKTGSELKKEAALLAAEERQLTNYAKLAALFGAGSLFFWLFAAAFSPWMGLLILPCTILGLVFGIKVLRRTRNIPEYRQQRKMGRFGIIAAGSQLAFGVLYLVVALLFLLLWGWW
jgi:hypothetical protein